MKREIVSVLVIVSALMIIGCSQEEPSPTLTSSPSPEKYTGTPTLTATSKSTPISTPFPHLPGTPEDVIPHKVKTDQPSYLPGETVRLTLEFENDHSKRVTLSPFPPKIEILHGITGRVVELFPAGTQEVELEPGDTISHTYKWNQLDESGEQVTPGSYSVMLGDVSISDGRGYGFGGFRGKVFIRYPQGAINKTVEVNESQTVGVTETLQRIEMSSYNTQIYVISHVKVEAPDVPEGMPAPPPTPPDSLRSPAYMEVDGEELEVEPCGFGYAGKRWSVEYVAEPVPSDAENLTFVVTEMGMQVCPWQFNVSFE